MCRGWFDRCFAVALHDGKQWFYFPWKNDHFFIAHLVSYQGVSRWSGTSSERCPGTMFLILLSNKIKKGIIPGPVPGSPSICRNATMRKCLFSHGWQVGEITCLAMRPAISWLTASLLQTHTRSAVFCLVTPKRWNDYSTMAVSHNQPWKGDTIPPAIRFSSVWLPAWKKFRSCL